MVLRSRYGTSNILLREYAHSLSHKGIFEAPMLTNNSLKHHTLPTQGMLGLQENMNMPSRYFEHYIWILRPQHGQGRKSKTQPLKNVFGIYGYACPLLTNPLFLTHYPSLPLYFHFSLYLCMSVCMCSPPPLYLYIHMCPSLTPHIL